MSYQIKINIFEGESSLREKYKINKDIIRGKTGFGFQTSRFEKGIEFIYPDRKVVENGGDYIKLRRKREGLVL